MLSKGKNKKLNFSDYFVLTEIMFISLPLLIVIIIELARGNYKVKYTGNL
jgi:hypothetical protein